MLLDDDDADDEGEEGDAILDEEEETEIDDSDVSGYVSVSLILFSFLLCKSINQDSLHFSQIQCGKFLHR